jgi:hypothetical protein
MLLEPGDQIGAFQIAGRKLKDQLFLRIHGCRDLPAIEDQKEVHCRVPDPLIAVNEGVIPNQGKPQGGRFFGKTWFVGT